MCENIYEGEIKYLNYKLVDEWSPKSPERWSLLPDCLLPRWDKGLAFRSLMYSEGLLEVEWAMGALQLAVRR